MQWTFTDDENVPEILTSPTKKRKEREDIEAIIEKTIAKLTKPKLSQVPAAYLIDCALQVRTRS